MKHGKTCSYLSLWQSNIAWIRITMGNLSLLGFVFLILIKFPCQSVPKKFEIQVSVPLSLE